MAKKKNVRYFSGQNEHETELFRLLSTLEGRYRIGDVFRDFLHYSALRISNLCEGVHLQERQEQMKELLQKYEKTPILEECFQSLTKAIVCNQQRGILRDVLGTIFEAIGLSNEVTGQFFTPEHVCRLMTKMTTGDKIPELEKKPYITVSDPCIGSGRMLLAFANEMQDQGYNYCTQMVGMAVDIDSTCVYMSYIQFSLYGIPAVVIHGNSLLVQEWSRWYTPAYILCGWVFVQPISMIDRISEDDKMLRKEIVEALFEMQAESNVYAEMS